MVNTEKAADKKPAAKTQAPGETPEANTEKAADKKPALDDPGESNPPLSGKGNFNRTFEEWKVDVTAKGEGQFEFDKIKKIKEVRLSKQMAETLNRRTKDSRILYIPKD